MTASPASLAPLPLSAPLQSPPTSAYTTYRCPLAWPAIRVPGRYCSEAAPAQKGEAAQQSDQVRSGRTSAALPTCI